MNNNINQDSLYRLLREFKANHFSSLEALQLFNAHAVGIGRKVVQGQPTDQLCLQFYVCKKRPLSELSPSQRIPSSICYFFHKENKEVELLQMSSNCLRFDSIWIPKLEFVRFQEALALVHLSFQVPGEAGFGTNPMIPL